MFNDKQFDAAESFLPPADGNLAESGLDQKRVQAYDLYENIYINSIKTLKIIIRGSDSFPILMPSGRKIVDATHRFLGVNLDYFVDSEPEGDEATRLAVENWAKSWFKRETLRTKFSSNKRWGLVRADAVFYVYADSKKKSGERISISELDPRQLFYIEDSKGRILGAHIVDVVADFGKPDDKSAKLCRRRTFRKQQNDQGDFTGRITSELTHWTLGKWDDRYLAKDKLEQHPSSEYDESEFELPETISQLPIYHWRNNKMQNTLWGTSLLAGFETLMAGINQSLTDEDATIVFQGLGMYVTNASPPVDPTSGEVVDWNIGPQQIIEIGTDNEFTRVTGVTELSPFQDHIRIMDEKGLSEAGGVPEVAVGRVDVQIAESGIALNLQFMPLLSANADREEEIINVLDQMFYDILHMWLPAYEVELFPSSKFLLPISLLSVFDDPMPKNRDAQVQETILLRTSNLILTTMVIDKLKSLGWEYPTIGPDGQTLTNEDIAGMLAAQAESDASLGLSALDSGNGFDAEGDQGVGDTPPDQTTIPLGVS